jgi:hypothetical protein
MRGPLLKGGIVLGAAGVYVAERWTRRTRATRTERTMPLPGDELVAEPVWEATRAADIDVPIADLWPWIVQMGFPTHRAGWYTPFWMDRLLFGITARSADCIVPDLQGLAVGDRVPDSDRGDTYFTVSRLEPPRALVLLSNTHPLPVYRDVAFSWAFVLQERGSGSRILMRARTSFKAVGPARLVRAMVRCAFGAGDIIQAGGMLEGIRRRAESADTGATRLS